MISSLSLHLSPILIHCYLGLFSFFSLVLRYQILLAILYFTIWFSQPKEWPLLAPLKLQHPKTATGTKVQNDILFFQISILIIPLFFIFSIELYFKKINGFTIIFLKFAIGWHLGHYKCYSFKYFWYKFLIKFEVSSQ